MKQEDKELLLKDLCARLPYRTMCATTDNDGSLPNIWEIVKADMINEDFFYIHDSPEAYRTVDVEEVKLYLFPLSSMTVEQIEEFNSYFASVPYYGDNIHIPYYFVELLIDFYNKHHLDWRGLIEKGLAIDCTNLNIY